MFLIHIKFWSLKTSQNDRQKWSDAWKFSHNTAVVRHIHILTALGQIVNNPGIDGRPWQRRRVAYYDVFDTKVKLKLRVLCTIRIKLTPYTNPNPKVQWTNHYGVCDIYQILLGWETYKYYYETVELPNPRPTQPKPRKNRLKVAFGPLFPTSDNFWWAGIGFVWETDYKKPNPSNSSANPLIGLVLFVLCTVHSVRPSTIVVPKKWRTLLPRMAEGGERGCRSGQHQAYYRFDYNGLTVHT